MRYALTQNNSLPFSSFGLFDDFINSKTLAPSMDLIQKDSEYQLKVDLPGFDEKDVSIEFENDILTIKGKREEESKEDGGAYVMRERRIGQFERSFRIRNVDSEKIAAKYASGVLTVTLPLREEVKAKKIAISFN